MKLLIHIDEIDKWPVALNNAANAKKELKDCEVEIISNGVSVLILKERVCENFNFKGKLDKLFEMGVKIKYCNNSLTKLDLKENEMLSYAIKVPAAIVEILKKQEEGFSYIKP